MLSCPGSREAPCARQFVLEMLHLESLAVLGGRVWVSGPWICTLMAPV